MHVYASRCSWNNWLKYYQEETMFLNDIFVTPETFRYRFINLRNNETIFSITLSLEEFKKHPSYADQTFWTPYNSVCETTDIYDNNIKFWDPTTKELKFSDMCSLLELSKHRTEPNGDGPHILNYKPVDKCGQIPLRIFVPSEKHNFTNFVYQVTKPRKAINEHQRDIHNICVVTNIPATIDLDNQNLQIFQPNWTWMFCPIELQSKDCDNNIEFKITITDPTINDKRIFKHMPINRGEYSIPSKITVPHFNISNVANNIDIVYLKSKCNEIDDMEIKIIDGVGNFTLEKKKDMRFGIGYKLFTGMVKYDNGIIS